MVVMYIVPKFFIDKCELDKDYWKDGFETI